VELFCILSNPIQQNRTFNIIFAQSETLRLEASALSCRTALLKEAEQFELIGYNNNNSNNNNNNNIFNLSSFTLSEANYRLTLGYHGVE
jgi:hypothetical protein